jgi:HSP20 family molecular chaperone IbpA
MNFFDEFDEFDKLFQRQFEALFRLLQNAPHFQMPEINPHTSGDENQHSVRWGPIIYGRTTIIGPDGKEHTQEWSNLTPESRKKMEQQFKSFPTGPRPQPRERSPIPDPLHPWQPFPGPQPEPQLKESDDYLIDIIDTKEGYVAVFDTPATAAEDIQTEADGRFLKVWVHGQVFRELELPEPVELKTFHFKNGVVELTLIAKNKPVESIPSKEPAE